MITVAIAEDDFRVAQLHEKFLEDLEEVEVIGKALNAEETLNMVKAHNPDLLLLDVYMPDRLGTELLHTLREQVPSLDIIMITAANDKTMIEKSMKYGIIDYIIKPVSMDRFRKTLETYKEKKRMINSASTFDQTMVDQLIGNTKPTSASNWTDVPKGIDPLTLDKMREMLNLEASGVTAEQASEKMGVSKTTARRYLEYLVSLNEGKAEMRYGKVGRPERKYMMK
ncbi:response regulator [Halobacillus yeomjeoni]|uniref:Response regulator n=1 Tax=Halobacillus yeomjeoni TaxID=311194 RepID=A0A931HWE0_9BACI|nr:response regulator [Halobacillus yeomjeoni]MBH0230824.1 response regulator [Halobacillus yeomjeoni]